MRYLLDTNVLVHLVNKSLGHELIELRIFSTQLDKMSISAVTVWEISRMIEKAKVPTKATKALDETMSLFSVIPLNDQIAAIGGSLSGWLSNRGLTIGDRDSMIAATAMSHKLIMVTDNVREFERVPGIVVENWRKAV